MKSTGSTMEAFDDNSMPDDRNTEKEKKISVKVCFIMKSTTYYSVHHMSTNNSNKNKSTKNFLDIFFYEIGAFENNSIGLPHSLSMPEESTKKEKETKIINKSLNVPSF
jgi:hypothetical protein